MGVKPHKKSHYGSKEHKLKCSVVGMNYRVTIPEQRDLAEDAPHLAVLEREPLNMYDRNAVKVLIGLHGDHHIGYVPRDVAALLAPKLDSGDVQIVTAWVTEIDADTGVGELLVTYRKKIRNHP